MTPEPDPVPAHEPHGTSQSHARPRGSKAVFGIRLFTALSRVSALSLVTLSRQWNSAQWTSLYYLRGDDWGFRAAGCIEDGLSKILLPGLGVLVSVC